MSRGGRVRGWLLQQLRLRCGLFLAQPALTNWKPACG
jgi:hypothetical protein